MVGLKLLIVCLLAVTMYYLFRTAQLGRHMAVVGAPSVAVNNHKRATHGVLCASLCAIVLLEFALRGPGLHPHPVNAWLLGVHLVFAITFFSLFLILKFWVTGANHPLVHKKLVYVALTCFALALPTGAWMLYQI